MRKFDLILVFTSFRRHENYLNIIKYLGKDISIGILKFKPHHKWIQTEDEYLDMCVKFGANLVEGEAECDTLIVSRFGGQAGSGYYKDILEDMPSYVKYRRVLVNVDSPMAGILKIRDICQYLGKPTILVQSKKYFASFEPDTKEFLKENPLETVEVGTVFSKYPIFEDFSTDYLLAYPSHTTALGSWQDLRIVKNLVKALKTLPKNAQVMVKPHNVRDKGNRLSVKFITRWTRLPLWLINFILFCMRIFDFNIGKKSCYTYLPNIMIRLFIYLQNDYIFIRCENLLDKYPGFGIEQFVPGVKKGIITGLSHTIISALIEKKPVYNIDDLPLNGRPENYRKIVDTFGVRDWQGFSSQGFDKIEQSLREADLIKYLKETTHKL